MSSQRPVGQGTGWHTDWVDHEYEPPTLEILEWVWRQVHPRARVTAVVRLLGGITADMDRITIDSAEGVKDVVLRP